MKTQVVAFKNAMRKKMENNQRLHSNKLIYNQQKNPQNIMDGHSKCEKYTSMNQHQTYNKNSTNVNCVNVRPPNCVRPATWIEGNQLVRDSVVVLFGVRFKFNSTINLWKCSHCKSRAVGTTDHYSFNLFTDFFGCCCCFEVIGLYFTQCWTISCTNIFFI